MKLRKWVFGVMILGLAVLGLVGCDSDSDKNRPDMEFDYPLTIGSSWQYERIFSVFFDEEAHANGLTDLVFNSVGSVEIMGSEVLFDNIEVYDFASSLTEEDNQPRLSNSYYNYDNNSLICYGYINSGLLDPKSNNVKKYYNFDNKKFSNPQEIISYLESGLVRNELSKDDSIYYDPAKCYVFPLYEDQEWNYRNSDDSWKIVKTVIGKEKVEVPAGKFDCWKIQWSYPESSWVNDIEYYEYVSQEGVVKRVIELRNSTITDEDGNDIGSYYSRSEQYLSDYEIVE